MIKPMHPNELFNLITNGVQVFTNYNEAKNCKDLCLLRSANGSFKNKIVVFHTFDKGKPREWAYVLDKQKQQLNLMTSKKAEELLKNNTK
jgi:hypothetical protein